MKRVKIMYVMSYGDENFLPPAIENEVCNETIVDNLDIIEKLMNYPCTEVESLPVFISRNTLIKRKNKVRISGSNYICVLGKDCPSDIPETTITEFYYNDFTTRVIEFSLLDDEHWIIEGEESNADIFLKTVKIENDHCVFKRKICEL